MTRLRSVHSAVCRTSDRPPLLTMSLAIGKRDRSLVTEPCLLMRRLVTRLLFKNIIVFDPQWTVAISPYRLIPRSWILMSD